MKKKFCPKCKSMNVIKESNVLLAIGVPQQWKCNECGYLGYIFPELEISENKNERRIK